MKIKLPDDFLCELDPADAVSVFILTPSRGAVLERLTGRGRDDDEVIQRRMNQAVDEISHYPEADFIVINDVFDTALGELRSIVAAQRLRVDAQVIRHAQLLQDLLS